MRKFPDPLLNQPWDCSEAFLQFENTFFFPSSIADFDPAQATGSLNWTRWQRKARLAFGQVMAPYEPAQAWEFPPGAYAAEPTLPFALEFITPRTIRLRVAFSDQPDTATTTASPTDSLMLAQPIQPEPPGASWQLADSAPAPTATHYTSAHGSVVITHDPFHVELRDSDGRLLTRTQHLTDTKSLTNSDPTPFSFVRRTTDTQPVGAASFSLSPDEKLFGCGESFTRLNKRGQKVTAYTNDAHGAQTADMYKPIPFFLSSRGYGMFVHTSTPVTFDFGHSFDGANVIYVPEPHLDIFLFLGTPQEIVSEYTALTGRSPVPPLWSFGLWMSRITYKSEVETRDVAAKLRQHKIPCDVIHLDTGWFETDWCCDYQFSTSRFDDPQAMIADLRAQGLRISLWQLPYFTPANPLYREALERGFVVRGADGGLPTRDAVVDFSNPDAVAWYQELLAGLLRQGVAAIKVDFGEAAPFEGVYASGRTGLHEHNLYPLRYNKAAAEVTERVTGESIIWARSTWAGSQRYPLHWGGDAENTDTGMAATLRSGLSLGLCGFTFWSHDIGGFVVKTPLELYRRWLPFGMLTSHSRCHGAPPKEPWAYNPEFVEEFRRAVELKYRLLPYIYAQAVLCAEQGHPMLRPLFFDAPEDPTSWLIEDTYLLGTDLLVAPLMEEGTTRPVYLPPGQWIDFQSGAVHPGGQWHTLPAGPIPIILLVRDGTALPLIEPALSTDELDWSELTAVAFSTGSRAVGHVCLPGQTPQPLRLHGGPEAFQLESQPLPQTRLRPAAGNVLRT